MTEYDLRNHVRCISKISLLVRLDPSYSSENIIWSSWKKLASGLVNKHEKCYPYLQKKLNNTQFLIMHCTKDETLGLMFLSLFGNFNGVNHLWCILQFETSPDGIEITNDKIVNIPKNMKGDTCTFYDKKTKEIIIRNNHENIFIINFKNSFFQEDIFEYKCYKYIINSRCLCYHDRKLYFYSGRGNTLSTLDIDNGCVSEQKFMINDEHTLTQIRVIDNEIFYLFDWKKVVSFKFNWIISNSSGDIYFENIRTNDTNLIINKSRNLIIYKGLNNLGQDYQFIMKYQNTNFFTNSKNSLVEFLYPPC